MVATDRLSFLGNQLSDFCAEDIYLKGYVDMERLSECL